MKKLMLVATLATLPILATVAETKVQGSGPNPYVECGIGAALFPTTAWAAVTSNAIWDLGTTAVTSALSSPETCNAKRVHTATLIMNSLEALEADVAQGGGATTQALASTMGCAGQEAALVSELRGTMASAVAAEGYATSGQTARANAVFQSVKAAASNAGLSCATAL
jgi:hypothetical protein